MKLRFTKSVIDRECLPPADGEVNSRGKSVRQKVYWDTNRESPKGFGMVVSRTCSTFILQRQIRGKTVRRKLGRYGELTLEQAREMARKMAVDLAGGVDPNSTDEWDSFTVREAMERHTRDMAKKGRRPRSISDIHEEMNRHMSGWLDRPIAAFRRRHCVERHEFLSRHSGPIAANRVLRAFRACWNTAAIHFEVDDQLGNPVGKKFPWNEQKSREPIEWDDLPGWAERVNAITNPIRRDLQWFIVLTGLRSTDARTVRWEHVDFEKGKLHRPEPKGGERRKFTVPISSAVLDILRRRRDDNELVLGASDEGWAFPTRDSGGNVTHVKEPKELETYEDSDGVKRKRVCLPSPHVLRHTFAHDAGVSFPAIQTLLNHVTKSSVTEHYTRPGEAALRQAADRIAEFLHEKAGIDGPIGHIIPAPSQQATG